MVDSGSDSDTQDLTQEWCEQQKCVSWEDRAQQERAWEEDKMDVPEELLKGIEEGWLESKMAMATTTGVGKWGGGKQRPPAKKTVMELQAGKVVLFTADTKARDGREKGAVKRTKRFPISITDLTGGGELTSKSSSSKRDAVESPDSRGMTAMQLASPEKLKKGSTTKAGEGLGKQMKIVSSASSPSPLKRKLQEGVQGMGNIGFSGMGFEEEQKRMRQTEAQMVSVEKKRMFELGRQAGISKWAGSAGNLAMKGTTMKGNVAEKGKLLPKSPVKVPLAMGKLGNRGKEEFGKEQKGQRQYLHSMNVSPMVKAMSELAKAKKRLMAVEGKLEARTVEMNAMKRRMQRLEIMVDSLQAGWQEKVQGGTGGRPRDSQGRYLDAW
jgi:hypothetical protein